MPDPETHLSRPAVPPLPKELPCTPASWPSLLPVHQVFEHAAAIAADPTADARVRDLAALLGHLAYHVDEAQDRAIGASDAVEDAARAADEALRTAGKALEAAENATWER
jgi:hypothetical protein